MKMTDLPIILFILFGVMSAFAEPQLGAMIDSRDGKNYRIVKIGEQTWMAENLNYEIENSFCYNDSLSNCQKYGRLYTLSAASKACPKGWHLPSEDEWFYLLGNVGFKKSRLVSEMDWADERDNGSDEFGFSVLPAGSTSAKFNDDINSGRVFTGKGKFYGGRIRLQFASFWTSSKCESGRAKYVPFNKHGQECLICGCEGRFDYISTEKNAGISVRCLKD